MSAGFNPAPWTASENHGCKSIYGSRLSDATSQIAYTVGLYDDDEDRANANLIAAAPDLYAALELAVSYGWQDDRALAALAKATGGAFVMGGAR